MCIEYLIRHTKCTHTGMTCTVRCTADWDGNTKCADTNNVTEDWENLNSLCKTCSAAAREAERKRWEAKDDGVLGDFYEGKGYR